MRELEGLLGLVLAAVSPRRRGAPRRRAVSGIPGGRRCAARVRPRRAVIHGPSRARAGAVRRARAARCGLRRVAERSQGQLGAGHRPGGRRRRPDNRRGRPRRARADPGDGLGAGDRARRRRRATRRRGRNRRAPPVATAASHPDDPRRREPAQRRQRAADLPARRRRRRDRRVLLAAVAPTFLLGGRRQPRGRAGARLARAAAHRSRAARADRHHSSVRQHVRRLARSPIGSACPAC